MRILLVSHLFPPHHNAGVESYTANLAGCLAQTHDVAVATTRKVPSLPTGTIRKHSVDGVPVFEVIQNLDYDAPADLWSDRRMERAFDEILREMAPDLIHFQHLMYWSLALPRLAKKRGIPSLLTLHDFWMLCPRMGQLIDQRGELCEGPEPERCGPCMASSTWRQPAEARRWMGRLQAVRRLTGVPLEGLLRWAEACRRRMGGAPRGTGSVEQRGDGEVAALIGRDVPLRKAAVDRCWSALDAVVSPSRFVLDRVVRDSSPALRRLHIPHGMDPGAFSAASGGRTAGPLRVGFLGTVAPHKGPRVLIEAAARLPEESLRLVLHGPDASPRSYADGCRARAASLPHVSMRGPLPRGKVPEFLGTLDVLCMPSLWFECQPLSLLEARLAGVPVLVSDLGGMAELVEEGKGGGRVRVGDVEAWAGRLAELSNDRERLRAWRASIPPVPTLTEHVGTLAALYAELVGQGPASG